jgi:hypothetical protein
MTPEHRSDEAAIREQAYYFWEQDGRPAGHEMEYWQRATIAVAEREQLSTLTDAPPTKPAAKRKVAEPKAAKGAARAKVAVKAKPKKK